MKKLPLFLLSSMATLVACDNTSSDSSNSTPQTTITQQGKGTDKQTSLWMNKTSQTDKGIIYTATLEATSGETSFGTPIKLIISCNNGQSELAINWGNHAPRGTKITTDLRIGNEQVITDDWRVIRETDLAYQYKPEKTLASLVNNKELIARTVYFKGGIVTAYFKLTGISSALTDIRKACHW